jgi:hypothetical protein
MARRITNSVDVRFVVSAHLGMPQGTKKTTHPLDRRFDSSVTVSTADDIRLPNEAEFCIQTVIVRMLDDSKYDVSGHQ